MAVDQKPAFVDVPYLWLNVHHGVLVFRPPRVIEHVAVDQVRDASHSQHGFEELRHIVVIAAWEAKEISFRLPRSDVGRFVAVAASLTSPEVPDPGIRNVVAREAVSLVWRVVADDYFEVLFCLKL